MIKLSHQRSHPPKKKWKHTIRDEDDDEAEEEPLVPVPSYKGKEKVESKEDSEDVLAYIDVELQAAAEKVTQTPATKKRLLDIIAEITAEEAAAVKYASSPTLQPPAKSPSTTTKTTSKRREPPLEVLQH